MALVPPIYPGRVAGLINTQSSAATPLDIGKPVTAQSLSPVESACLWMAGNHVSQGGMCIPVSTSSPINNYFQVSVEPYTRDCRVLVRLASDNAVSTNAALQFFPTGYSSVTVSVPPTGGLGIGTTRLVEATVQVGDGDSGDMALRLVRLSFNPSGASWRIYSCIFEPVPVLEV